MQKKFAARRVMSGVLIIAGIVLIAAAICIEAYHYPWGTLFNISQEESSISDPNPISLKGGDAGSVIEESGIVPLEDTTIDVQEETGILPGSESADAPPDAYIKLGIIKIPKLKVSQYVLDGTQRQMRYGVGHVSSTDGIGSRGNCVIAGHRSDSFRYLDKLSDGDSIFFKVEEQVYTYSVYDSFTVLPDETWVLTDIKGEPYTLTLITCTPYLVSSHRLIIRARLTDINGKTPEGFYNGTFETAGEPLL